VPNYTTTTFKLCCRTPVKYKYHDKGCPTTYDFTKKKPAVAYGFKQPFTWEKYANSLEMGVGLIQVADYECRGSRGTRYRKKVFALDEPHECDVIQRLSEAYRELKLK